MPPVKSTATIIDLQAKELELKNKISAIKSKQEVESGKLQIVLSSVDDAVKRQKSIEDSISNMTSSALIIYDLATDVISDIKKLFELKKVLLDDFEGLISKINGFVAISEHNIDEAVTKYDGFHKDIMKEQKEIEVKTRDLNVYKKRIEEKASELGIKIIL
jgi:predicted transcriptional regulator